MRKDIKASVGKRLGRIEGQVRGLSKMVEEEVLKDHVAHCVEHAISSGDKADQREKIAELMAVIGRAER